MTEDEAKNKWCPFVRHGGAGNRIVTEESPMGVGDKPWNKCIASACMAWRCKGAVENQIPYKLDYYGHCGLVGEP